MTVNPQPSSFLTHRYICHSGHSSVPEPPSLGFQDTELSCFSFLFRCPLLAPILPQTCALGTLLVAIYTHSVISSHVMALRKNFCCWTSKCTDPTQAFSHKPAHPSSCSLLFLLRHPVCISNETCPAPDTQSSPKTFLPAVLSISVNGHSIFLVAQAKPRTQHYLFFLSLHTWPTSKSLGSSLASPITSVLFEAIIISCLVCENVYLICLLTPTLYS